jgi:hypothetical protein
MMMTAEIWAMEAVLRHFAGSNACPVWVGCLTCPCERTVVFECGSCLKTLFVTYRDGRPCRHAKSVNNLAEWEWCDCALMPWEEAAAA